MSQIMQRRQTFCSFGGLKTITARARRVVQLGARGYGAEHRNSDGDEKRKLVERIIEKERGCLKFPSAMISARGVRYRNDMYEKTCEKAEYEEYQERCERRMNTDLKHVERTIERVSVIERNTYVVLWTVTFVPEKITWLYEVAISVNAEITRKDILDKMGERTKFTYRALFQTLTKLFLKKRLIIPVAKIEGRSTLMFTDGELFSHEESLTLVKCINKNEVKNKRVMRDVLEYLDCRKPRGKDFREWDILVEEKLDIYSVPGMRTLDVDGLEDFQQQANIEDATAFLGFMTVIVLGFGFGIGGWYFDSLRHDQLIQKMIEQGAY